MGENRRPQYFSFYSASTKDKSRPMRLRSSAGFPAEVFPAAGLQGLAGPGLQRAANTAGGAFPSLMPGSPTGFAATAFCELPLLLLRIPSAVPSRTQPRPGAADPPYPRDDHCCRLAVSFTQ